MDLVPLVRWQFQGLPESQRKAFLFENVIDARGRRFASPVLVAAYAPSREIYALGLKCRPEEIPEIWAKGQDHPIAPVMVETGPAQEEIHMGEGLLAHGGLEEFPMPVTTPGFDNAPYLSAASWVSKDPETGIRNVGVYRGMVKSRTRLGINCLAPQHLRTQWEKCRERGIPLPAAIIIGGPPSIGYVGVGKFPYGVDEYTIAGGMTGEAVPLIKCKTVDLEVPATAEIIIEGELPTDSLEREGPHGEHTGYVGLGQLNPYFNVTCITHRINPVYAVFVDDDINPHDMNAVLWALCYRAQPHRDMRITPGKTAALDPSAMTSQEMRGRTERAPTSAMLIDATRKWEYPPVALPKKEFMERAKRIWEEEGLPSLEPRALWFGYSLGDWSREDEEEAELALRGEHYQTGEKLAKERIKI